jgi:hypothetical protein
MTIDEALARASAFFDEIYSEKMEESIARMADDNIPDETIEEVERIGEEQFKAWRADALADLRKRLMQMMH